MFFASFYEIDETASSRRSTALPQAQEETDPSFQHFNAASLPTIEDDGVRARVIAGSSFGIKSPVGTLSEWLYAEVSLAAGASAPLDS